MTMSSIFSIPTISNVSIVSPYVRHLFARHLLCNMHQVSSQYQVTVLHCMEISGPQIRWRMLTTKLCFQSGPLSSYPSDHFIAFNCWTTLSKVRHEDISSFQFISEWDIIFSLSNKDPCAANLIEKL